MRPVPTMALLLLILSVAWIQLAAQEAQTPDAFDVISIKPIEPGLPYPNFFIEGDRLRGNHVTAELAIARAYGVDRRQVVGGPPWVQTDRFNIDARAGRRLPSKTESGDLQEPVAGMLRSLLADRFGLSVRREAREMLVYALIRVRPDVKPSERHLRQAKVDCTTELPPDEEKARFADCFERTGGEMHVRGRSIERLAFQLTRHLGRDVINETGLSGLFDVDLRWEIIRGAPEQQAILVALEDQLGMKLQERMAPRPVVVIERIVRPTSN